MTNEELGKALSYFIVEVRNEAGKEYRPNTVYEIIISIQHHLRSSGKFVNFLDDNAFAKMKAILDAKMKSLSKQGLGIDKKQADIISMEQEEILWSRGILGSDNPRQLLNTMVNLIRLNFALRAGQEHRNLRFGKDSQISLKPDSCGRRYLQYTEDISKTNTGGLQHRKLAPKSTRAYESEIKERCIVTLYLKYIGARPQEGKTEAFYLRPKANMDGRCWYMDAPVGVHTLQQVVKKMCSEAGFEGQYTNHSLRATATTRLSGAGVDEQIWTKWTRKNMDIVQVQFEGTNVQVMNNKNRLKKFYTEMMRDMIMWKRKKKCRERRRNVESEENLTSTEVRTEAGNVKICVV